MLDPLPCWRHLAVKEQRRRAKDLIREIEREARAERHTEGLQPLGAEGVMTTDPHFRPQHLDRSPAPPIHARRKHVRRAMWESYAWVVAKYLEASERLRVGDRRVSFPEGTFPLDCRSSPSRAADLRDPRLADRSAHGPQSSRGRSAISRAAGFAGVASPWPGDASWCGIPAPGRVATAIVEVCQAHCGARDVLGRAKITKAASTLVPSRNTWHLNWLEIFILAALSGAKDPSGALTYRTIGHQRWPTR